MQSKNSKLLTRFINEVIVQIDGDRWFIDDNSKDKVITFLDTLSDKNHGITKLDKASITKYLSQALEEHAPKKATKFKYFLDNVKESMLKRLTIEKLYTLYRQYGAEFIEDLYSLKIPIKGQALTIPHTLLSLNDIVTHGRSKKAGIIEKVDTVGRGEITTMFTLEDDTLVDPGSKFDLTINKKHWHVKDASNQSAGINAIDLAPMGKSGGWDRDQWPFNMFKKLGINLAEITARDMTKNALDIANEYNKKYGKNRVLTNQQIIDHMQEDLDNILRNSDSWGDAEGVIVLDKEKLYFVGHDQVHFSPTGTSQNALRFTVNLRKDAGIYGALDRALNIPEYEPAPRGVKAGEKYVHLKHDPELKAKLDKLSIKEILF